MYTASSHVILPALPDNGSYRFGQSRIIQACFEALDQGPATQTHFGVRTGKRNHPAYSDPADSYANAIFVMTLPVRSKFEYPGREGVRIELQHRLDAVVLALGPYSSSSDEETEASHHSTIECRHCGGDAVFDNTSELRLKSRVCKRLDKIRGVCVLDLSGNHFRAG